MLNRTVMGDPRVAPTLTVLLCNRLLHPRLTQILTLLLDDLGIELGEKRRGLAQRLTRLQVANLPFADRRAAIVDQRQMIARFFRERFDV